MQQSLPPKERADEHERRLAEIVLPLPVTQLRLSRAQVRGEKLQHCKSIGIWLRRGALADSLIAGESSVAMQGRCDDEEQMTAAITARLLAGSRCVQWAVVVVSEETS